MIALALDTSTPVLSAALVEWQAGTLRVLARREAGPPQVTSTVVPGVFDDLLGEAGLTLNEVNVLVAGLGPGLFTGARVAVATMKAIAYARRLPLLGAGSLEAMALANAATADPLNAAAIPDTPVLCPIIDARKGEVYFALYRFEKGELVTVDPPRACPPAELSARLQAIGAPVRTFGTGPGASSPATPGARELAYFALQRSPEPSFDLNAVLALEPVYLRPPEAEVALKRRQAGATPTRS